MPNILLWTLSYAVCTWKSGMTSREIYDKHSNHHLELTTSYSLILPFIPRLQQINRGSLINLVFETGYDSVALSLLLLGFLYSRGQLWLFVCPPRSKKLLPLLPRFEGCWRHRSTTGWLKPRHRLPRMAILTPHSALDHVKTVFSFTSVP